LKVTIDFDGQGGSTRRPPEPTPLRSLLMIIDTNLSADTALKPRAPRQTVIVFCHLRWGFVYQRPQHLLTRLARHFDILFVEEPVFAEGEPRLACAPVTPGVEVLTPHTPERMPGFDDRQLPWIARLLDEFLAHRGTVSPLVWLYTPLAWPLVGDLEPCAVIYDCMDDLASFKFAPPALVERELELIREADVVLTGGPSLYEARIALRPDVQCLPSAVDVRHFSKEGLIPGSEPARIAQALHAGLSSPRLGFFGVIDERIDTSLIAELADRRQDWQLVMAGPVVKIDPAALPRRSNIHWIGMQGYDTLPYLLAHWDVAMLPFALNEATRFISPTKTLEYLAGGLPVVSTPIRDVVSLYGGVVRIASTAADFIEAASAAMNENVASRALREQEARAIVARSTWDVAAARVLALLSPFLEPAANAPRIEEKPRAAVPMRASDGATRAGASIQPRMASRLP
jgi:UDP-galactopyranose mutase